MTDLLVNWLNNDIKLSRKISNIDKDFSNGYLYAELLFKFKQIPNIKNFNDSNNINTIDKNFLFLEHNFKNLNIQLNQENLKKLKNGEKNQNKKILYLIKMYFSNKKINLNNLWSKNSDKMHKAFNTLLHPSISQKSDVKIANENNDFFLPNIYNNKIKSTGNSCQNNKINLSLNSLHIDQGYEYNEKKYYRDIEDRIKENNDQVNFLKSNLKKNIYNNERQYCQDLKIKEENQKINFKRYLDKKADWKKDQLELNNKENNYLLNKLIEKFNLSEKDTEVQIDTFEKNMQKLGIDITTIDDKFNNNKKKHNIPMSSQMLMQKVKEKIEANHLAKKEKERRNRKIYYEQNKAKEALEKALKEKNLSESNFDFSKLESNKDINVINCEKLKHEIDKLNSSHSKQLEFEKWRYIHDREKKLFERNKNFYEKLESKNITEKNYLGNPFTFRRNQLHNHEDPFDKEQFYKELNSVDLNLFDINLNNKKEKKINNFILIKDVIDQLIDLTEEIYNYKENLKNKQLERANLGYIIEEDTTVNTDSIEIEKWKDWMQKIIENAPIRTNYFNSDKNEDEDVNLKKDPFLVQIARFNDISSTYSNKFCYNREYKKKDSICSIYPKIKDNKLNFNESNLKMKTSKKSQSYVNNLINSNKQNKDINKIFSSTSIIIRFLNKELCELYDYEYSLGNWIDTLPDDIKDNKKLKYDAKDIVTLNEICSILSVKIQINNDFPELTTDLKDYLTVPLSYESKNLIGEMIETLLEIKHVYIPLTSEAHIAYNKNTNSNNLNSNAISVINNKNSASINNISSHNFLLGLPCPAVYEANSNYYLKENCLLNIPIKLCIIGHRSSGKKTLIKGIENKYPFLKVYNIYSSINNWINIYNKLEKPIEEDPKFKSLKKNQLDLLIKEREEEKASLNDIEESIKILKNQYENNENFDDNIVVNLLIYLINKDFNVLYTNDNNSIKNNIDELINKYNKINEIYDDINKIKEEQQLSSTQIINDKKKPNIKGKTNQVNNEQTLQNELKKVKLLNLSGFIIVDFPNNIKQAKLFENFFTNYTQEIEKYYCNSYDNDKEKLNFLYESIIKQHYLSQTPIGAVNKIIYINCNTDECVRRTVLQRLDPITGNIYHIEDNPPNMHDPKLLDRLKPIDQKGLSEPEIREFNKQFDYEFDNIEYFYSLIKVNNQRDINTNFKSSNSNLNNNNNLVNAYTHGIKNKLGTINSNNVHQLTDNLSVNPSNNINIVSNSNFFKSYLHKLNCNVDNIQTDNLLNKNYKYNKEEKDTSKNIILDNDNKLNETKSIKKEIKNVLKSTNKDANQILQKEYNASSKYKSKDILANEVESIIIKLIEMNEEKEIELIKNYSNKDNSELFNNYNNINVSNNSKKNVSAIEDNNKNNLTENNKQRKDKSIVINNQTRHLSDRASKQLSINLGDEVSRKDGIHNIEEEELGMSQSLLKKINEFKKRCNLIIVDNLIDKIKDTSKNYIENLKLIFNYIEKHDDYVANNMINCQNIFIEFFNQDSDKEKLLNDYMKHHNKIINQIIEIYNRSFEFKTGLKFELHNKADNLNNNLWNIINKKKEDAIKERLKILDSKFIEDEMNNLYIIIEKMLFLETEKLFKMLEILKDFYQIVDKNKIYINLHDIKYKHFLNMNLENFSLEKDNLSDNFNKNKVNNYDDNIYIDLYKVTNTNSDLKSSNIKKKTTNIIDRHQSLMVKKTLNSSQDNIITFNLNKIEDFNNTPVLEFPKLAKLVKNCIYVLFKFEDNLTMLRNLHQGKDNYTISGNNKKPKIKKQILYCLDNNSDEVKPNTFSHNNYNINNLNVNPWEEEFKNAVKDEINKYRFKVSRIKHWGDKQLTKYRLCANNVFKNMDEWIVKNVKEENNKLNDVIVYIKTTIEHERHINLNQFIIKKNINYDKFDVKEFMHYFNNVKNDTKKNFCSSDGHHKVNSSLANQVVDSYNSKNNDYNNLSPIKENKLVINPKRNVNFNCNINLNNNYNLYCDLIYLLETIKNNETQKNYILDIYFIDILVKNYVFNVINNNNKFIKLVNISNNINNECIQEEYSELYFIIKSNKLSFYNFSIFSSFISNNK